MTMYKSSMSRLERGALSGLATLGAFACSSPFEWLGGGDCAYETVQLEPIWACSEDVMALLAADEAALGVGGDGAAVSATDPVLVAQDICAGGDAAARAAMNEVSTELLRTQRMYMLASRCRPRTGSRLSGNCADGADADLLPANSGSVEPVLLPEVTPTPGAAQYSGTNNQVAGVDEADFVKNDARYVYTIASSSAVDGPIEPNQERGFGELVIFDVWPPEQAHEASRITVEGAPKKLQLEGDRLLVYASAVPSRAPDDVSAYGPYGPYDPYGPYGPYGFTVGGYESDCSYGYDCVPAGDGTGTVLTVYDVSDRTAPVALRRVELSGSYINSRRIGDVVHTVVSDPVRLLPGLEMAPSFAPDGPEAAIAAFADLAAANERLIAEATVEDVLPRVTVEASTGAGAAAPLECGMLFAAPGGTGRGFLSVVSLSLADDGAAPRRAAVLSDAGFTYASAGALYVAVPHSAFLRTLTPTDSTLIHKFELDGLDTRYAASGAVEGRVLNQFAMDEFDGHLRVAATNGHVPNPDAHSALSVLEQVDTQLVTVGKLDDIAPGEDIRSVRFAAERGYVVTFKKTDPLFVFDLADPRAPAVAGELKIPGFSTYIHPLDEGHLLSIGYDADDQGDFAWFRGVELQIFDVADMSSPRLLHKTVIGTRGSSSEALDDHLAFTYFAPKRWLSVPITICEGGTGPQFGHMTFSGLYLYDVSLESGLGLLGSVAHPPSAGDGGYAAANCSNWWSSASSQVKRSIVMDDYVLSLSDTELKLNHSADLARDVAVLPLAR